MQFVEVMVAAVVFTAASGSSLQLWSRAAGSSQQVELRQQLLERIELDRLQLQAHWRQAACGLSREQLIAVAAALPVPPQLQRELAPGDGGDAIQVRWRAEADPGLQRERWFTPAGLGLCQAEPPLTDSQVEEVVP